ncbi:integral membrane protein (Pth11), putative [Macrophomina phaseolina MS6]|uniref:Integral membrane protein (Pth11), putative n=1 Tax=Macrophomina phaseolina (strain MS6) TaxID=1126212 RepID=K2RXF5_MACPH|nr:integral membrane protein (Pth11), putative [Macrophomina phaseolina MS6]
MKPWSVSRLEPALTASSSWAPMLSKFSILILYHRLNPSKPFRLATYALMAIIVGYAMASTIVISAVCRPTDSTKIQCINNLTVVQAVVNITTGGLMVLLPLPIIQRLHFPIGERMIVFLLLAGGAFAVAASITRIVIIQNIQTAQDYTWERVRVSIWSTVEINVIIICQCMIALKPLIKQYLPGMLDDGIYPQSPNAPRSRSRISLPFSLMAAAGGKGTTRVAGNSRISKGWWRSPNKDEIIITNTYEVRSTYELQMGNTESMENIILPKR